MSWGWRSAVVFLGLAAFLTYAGPLRGEQETALPVAKVPPAVRQGADKAVPGAKWMKAFQSTEEDETLFGLIGRDAKGREIEVELTPAGRVLEIETGMPMNDVPKPILDVVSAKARGVKIERARSVSQNGAVVAYSFHGKNARAQVVAIRVSKDGKAIQIEVEGGVSRWCGPPLDPRHRVEDSVAIGFWLPEPPSFANVPPA